MRCSICEELQKLIGKKVKKKSGKPFQNKKKIATISEITKMTIPMAHPDKNKLKTVDAVYLKGCDGKVRLKNLMVIGD